MTAKYLIELLQTMNPELPIQIRMGRIEPQESGETLRINDLRPIKSDPFRYSLQSTDVVDTWNGETGAVAIELSLRIS